jgi:hypothetical protein
MTKYKPTSPKQQSNLPPVVTGMDDLFPVEQPKKTTIIIPPIAYVGAFVVAVAMMSLMAAVLH